MNNEKINRRPVRPHGPAGRGAPGEKPKNLKEAVKKLIFYLKPYRFLIFLAIILAALSSVLSIIGPDKLRNLTDEISKGLVINTESFELIKEDIDKDIKNNIIINEEDLNSLTPEDRELYDKTISNLNNLSDEDKFISIVNLPASVKTLIFKDKEINGTIVTSMDKVEILDFMLVANSENMYDQINMLDDHLKDLIKPKMDLNKIKTIALTLVIMYVLSALFSYTQNYLMVRVANSFSKTQRRDITRKINNLPLKYFDTHSYGDILSRVTNDVESINMSLHNSLGSLVSAVALLIGSLIMMFKTNIVLALISIASSLIGFVFISIITMKSQKYFIARQDELGKLNGHIEEIYSNHNVVKAYNGVEEANKTFDEYNSGLYNANRMSQFLSGIMGPMMGFVGNIGYVAVCVVGSVLVLKGTITFGVIVAFIMYVRLFSSPLTQIAGAIQNLQTATAAGERVFEFVEEKELKDESHITKHLDPTKVKGNIEFNHVKFGYDKDKIIIKDFNCKVKPGQKIAIVGPTGAGKTTIVNLLMKFYEINSGDIKIDGVSTKELTRENIHSLFIMVLQDTWLFNGTIRDNIKFNNGSISDEEIWNALSVVGVDHFVKTLPKTLNYRIEDNESISSGQKQLLTIARGMIEDSPFLILDEATSSVDTRTEELVQKAMDKLTEGRTSFIIAHRLSTIKNADLILVMKEGNIIETGTHEELLKKNGFYAELYNSQFQN